MLDITPSELEFRGVSLGTPHKMHSQLHLSNPTSSTVFYRVRSSHSVYYSLYVSPVSGKILPGQSVEVHFILPSIASVRHSAHPLQFVVQHTAALPNSDLRTFWKYVDYLDVVETPINVKILPFEEEDFVLKDSDHSDADEELFGTSDPLPIPHAPASRHIEEDHKASCSFEDESRNDVVLRLIQENRSLRSRLLTLEKAADFYDDAIRSHACLVEENSRLRNRIEKFENLQVPFNCCICLEEKPNTIIYPCRHVIMCSSCASKCPSRCPTCRTLIVNKAQVYF